MESSVAIVTGAGQGIGRAIALRLAQDGFSIVAVDLRQDTLDQVATEIQALGGHVLPLSIDITRSEHREQMINATLEHFQRLDVLVNNAAIQRMAMPLDVTEEHWDAIMNVNAKAAYFCCQCTLKHMTAQRSGCIVNMASIAGKMASTIYHPIYNVSKAAVLAMTKTLALAYAPSGVRINAVCPGIIETPMQDIVDTEISHITGQQPNEIRAERVGRIPLARIGEPTDVAAVVSFLVGPDARYMTGQALNVDGGIITY
jgi:meso-butanediol dehydrogenase / (S,S)-butanediol dehydrogenase / diacetyl reductase